MVLLLLVPTMSSALREEIDYDDEAYSNEWYTYSRTVNVSTHYLKSATGNVRVCNLGDGAKKLSTNIFCVENRLGKPTVRIVPGSWEESKIIAWIAAIIMREQMHVPTTVEAVGASSQEFFPTSEMYYSPNSNSFQDTLNVRKYNWDALSQAHKTVRCSHDDRRTIPIPNDLEAHDACKGQVAEDLSSCKPCAHAMLDVWGSQELELENAIASRTIEEAGKLGIVARQGWYAPKSIIENFPSIATYYGMKNSSLTGSLFQRPIPFGEYCYLRVVKRTIVDEDIPAARVKELNSSVCDRLYNKYPSNQLDPVKCAHGLLAEAENVYKLCNMFYVTRVDIERYAPKVLEELTVENIVYSGFTVTETFAGEKTSTLLHLGCRHNIPPYSVVSPGGGRFSSIDLNDFPFNLTTYNLVKSSHMVEAWETVNRLRHMNHTSSGVLLSLSRPNALFVRHKYSVSGFTPGQHDTRAGMVPLQGKEWELERVELPLLSASCLKSRAANMDRCPNSMFEKPNASKHFPGYSGCDFAPQRVYKVFVENLREYNEEAWYFLSQFQIENEDIEEIMGDIYYNPVYFDAEANIAARRRMVVADWIEKNLQRWKKWIPESAKTLRCLGEQGSSTTLTGRYTKGVSCSGHGVCQADKFIQYAGVCRCERGWTGMVTIQKVRKQVDDCSLLDVGDSINLKRNHPIVIALQALCFVMIPSIAGGLLVVSILCRKLPMIFHAGLFHAVFLCTGIVMLSMSFEFWIGEPDKWDCILRPGLGSLGYSIILAVNIAKFHFILDTVANVREFQEDIVVIENRALIRDVCKLAMVPLILGTFMYLADPAPQYYRVEGKIWLKYMECNYHFSGKVINMFNVWYQFFLQGLSFVYAVRLYNWMKVDQKFYLYIREDNFMQLTVLINGVGCIFSWMLFVNNTSPNEEAKLGAIASILAFFGIPSLALHFLPKIMTSVVKPRWNSIKMIYKRKITAMEIIEAKISSLYAKIEQVDILIKQLKRSVQENEKRFQNDRSGLVEQVFLIKAVLGKQLPTLKNFFRSMQMDKLEYIPKLSENKLNVNLILERKGNLYDCNPPINMTPAHNRLFAKGLFRLERALKYHSSFISALPSTPRTPRPDSDEEGMDDEVTGIVIKDPYAKHIKHLHLLDYDSAEEEESMTGTFVLAPLAQTTQGGFVERVQARKEVVEAMNDLEAEYGRRSPELMIAASITGKAMTRAVSHESSRMAQTQAQSPYKIYKDTPLQPEVEDDAEHTDVYIEESEWRDSGGSHLSKLAIDKDLTEVSQEMFPELEREMYSADEEEE